MRVIKEAKEDWLYMQLHMFKQGLLAAVHIKDDLIFELRDNGILVLRFDDNSDYFKLFGFDEYTIGRLSHMFSSYGGGYEYFDSYTANEDWNQGYLYNYFNNENKELFEEIKQYLSPELDLDDNNDLISFCKLLDDTFSNRVGIITGDYSGEMDAAIETTLKEAVREDLCDIFMTDGIYQIGNSCFYKYYTTVDNLIKLYDRFNDKTSDISGLLEKLGEEKGVDNNEYNDWYEYHYHDNFDEDSFNRTVNWNLEKIKDELFDSDNFKDIEEFKKIRETLSKFTFNKWYDLPKDKNKMFKIIGVDPTTNHILYEYKIKNTMDFKKGKLDLKNFNLFLFQPELF